MTAPRLSVVATSRNDDHGGSLLARMQYFVDGLAARSGALGGEIELVLVEWNPPPDRAPLVEALRWPAAGLVARVITVPAAVHDGYPGAGALGLFQMIAKNVGIRRATGDLVLATNVDIVLSEALARRVAQPLPGRTVIRADRHDIELDVDDSALGLGDLERAAQSPKRIMRRDGVHYPGRGRVVPTYQGIADALRWRHRAGQGAPSPRGPEQAGRAGSIAARLADRASAALGLGLLPKLHLNACGDFTLVDRAGWAELRGYPEWPMFSWNLDSVLLYQAEALGFGRLELPATLSCSHIEQSRGSAWTPEGRGELFARIEEKGLPYLSDADLRRFALGLRLPGGRHGRTRRANDGGWGLAELELEERVGRAQTPVTGSASRLDH